MIHKRFALPGGSLILVSLLIAGSAASAASPAGPGIVVSGSTKVIRPTWQGPVTFSPAEPSADAGAVPAASAETRAAAAGPAMKIRRTNYGAFAFARLPPDPAWKNAAWLEVTVRTTTSGVFSINLREEDAAGQEAWILSSDLEPGTHTLRYRLAARPQGDLKPAIPRVDGKWNPDDAGVRALRMGFSHGEIEILSLRLARGTESE